MNKEKIIEFLASGYDIELEDAIIEPLESGLINNTYLLKTGTTNKPQRYIAQQINIQVFTAPNLLNENVATVSEHLLNDANYPYDAFSLVKTRNGQLFFAQSGQVWRLLTYLEDTYSVNHIDSATRAYQAAKAFGEFAVAFKEFEATELHEVIPDFHNLSLRFYQLEQAIEVNLSGRLAQASELLEVINQHKDYIQGLEYWQKSLKKRVTHNDTKVSNLLFDNISNQVRAVIDLDTCMSGLLLFDFGDMVRSGCNNATSESDSQSSFNTELCMAMTKGYLDAVGDFISTREKFSLWFGVKLMPLMLAIRFLTDYLNGDAYFKVDYPEQNRDRANNQLTLFLDICAKEAQFLPLFEAK